MTHAYNCVISPRQLFSKAMISYLMFLKIYINMYWKDHTILLLNISTTAVI